MFTSEMDHMSKEYVWDDLLTFALAIVLNTVRRSSSIDGQCRSSYVPQNLALNSNCLSLPFLHDKTIRLRSKGKCTRQYPCIT